MFLLRCAFWLGVGFLVIQPFTIDSQYANASAKEALNVSKGLAIETTAQVSCNDLTCMALKSAAIASLSSNEETSVSKPIVEAELNPPPRPDWAN